MADETAAGGGEVAQLRGEVARLRAAVERLSRRVDGMAGEVRAAVRQTARTPAEPHQAVRRAEAAALLRMKPATLAKWASLGAGPPFFMLGNRAWYRLADLTAWREAAEAERTTGRTPRPDPPAADSAPRLPGV